MNRRVKLKLALFVFMLAMLLCIYFVIPTHTVDRFHDKFIITGTVSIVYSQML